MLPNKVLVESVIYSPFVTFRMDNKRIVKEKEEQELSDKFEEFRRIFFYGNLKGWRRPLNAFFRATATST